MNQDEINRTRGLSAVLGALALVLGVTHAGTASAQTACGDMACPRGYACESVPAPCPAIACAPGSDCPPCNGTTLACVAEPCSSDAQCDIDMVCLSETITECTGEAPACEPGRECDADPPRPSECTSVERSQCVPRWALECRTAADCGAGFACVEQQSCQCTGSAPSSGSGSAGRPAPEPSPLPPETSSGGASSGGGAGASDPKAPPDSADAPAAPTPAIPPDDCSCTPSGRSACVPIERACSVDADCPLRWTCEDNPEGVCWAAPDGSMGCEPADPPRLCVPPYQNLGGYGYPTRGEDSSGSGGMPAPGGAVPPASPGEPAPEGPSTTAPKPAADPSPVPGETLADTPETNSRGCSLAMPTSAGGAGSALFGLAMALVFAARRRREGARL